MARLAYTLDAIAPNDFAGEYWRVGLESSQIQSMMHEDGKTNDKVRLYRLKLVDHVVKNPSAIFKNLMRENHEDGYCYCGLPQEDYRRKDVTTPPPPGCVFCVFIESSGKIFDWRWETADTQSPHLPEDWSTRFGEQIWPA